MSLRRNEGLKNLAMMLVPSLYFDVTLHNLKAAYKILIMRHEGKQRIRRLTSRGEDDNIKADCEDIRYEYVQ